MSFVEGFKDFLQTRMSIPAKGHRVIEAFERPPVIALGVENLYGVPVLDILEGYKGQVIAVEIIANYTDMRHKLPTMGLRLKLGYTMLFAGARPKDERRGRPGPSYAYPVVVNGVVTPYVELLKRPELRFTFYEYRMDVGEFEVAVDDIITLEQVMSGECPILVTDKYGVRSIEKLKETKRLLELSHLAETLTRELQRYQVKAEEERRNARMAINMAEYYKRQIEDAMDKIQKMSKEYYSMREELEKQIENMRVKLGQLEVTSHAEMTFKQAADSYLSQIGELVKKLEALVSRLGRLGEELEEAIAPPAMEEKKGEAGGGEGG
ncbi:MAG: hypothetical protein QW692_00070 [Nitrososphaerota archaeon]